MGCCGMLMIHGQSSVEVHPGEGSLDRPPASFGHEAFHRWRPLGQAVANAKMHEQAGKSAPVAFVRQNLFWPHTLQVELKTAGGRRRVMAVGGRNGAGKDAAMGIGEDVALASVDMLGSVCTAIFKDARSKLNRL